jgi:hypothetical protein
METCTISHLSEQIDKSVEPACSASGEAGAVPEPAQLQLQGQEHQGDASL